MAHPLIEFGEHLERCDGDIECGEVYSLQRGWQAYMRAGEKVLILPPRAMRKLGEKYRDHAEAPAEVRDLGKTMIKCANAAKEKNRRHVIPDAAVAFLPHQGNA